MRSVSALSVPLAASLHEKAARLRHTLLFDGVAPDALREIAGQAEVASFGPGEIVVREAEPGDALYIVTSGMVRVYRQSGSRTEVLGEIHKGGFFGEFALIEARPRTATVATVSETRLLRLSREAVRAHAIAYPEVERRLRSTLERRRAAGRRPFRPPDGELRAALSTLLDGVTADALDTVGDDLEWLWLPAGDTLLREGEPGDAVYFVLDGLLHVYTRDRGVTVTLGNVGAGESVGEMALLSGAPRSASVSALIDCSLLRLSRTAFDALLADRPATLTSFRRVMLTRVAARARAEARAAYSLARPALTIDDCDDVLRTRDFVLRNFRITHSYHRLALDLADVIGAQDVNWPAFGAHASKTAGYSIRMEELPLCRVYRALCRSRWFGHTARRAGDRIARSRPVRDINRVLACVSVAVSDGNLRIFGDMAPVIVRFLETVRADRQHDAAKFAAFRASLRPGPSEQDGQDLLGDALAAWYEAAHESDSKRRSELVLLGNARMGLHEQIRIQPDIEDALGAPLRRRLGDELGLTLHDVARPLPKPVRHALRRAGGALQRAVIDVVSTALRRLVTRRMMRLRLPGGSIRLGEDVPVRIDGDAYPPTLRELTHPPLVEIVGRYVRNADSTRGSAAVDWTRLDDRMNYIIQLFRSRQNDRELFTPPLDPVQVAALSDIDPVPEPAAAA
jgi:CRP-like cAMP-binding protein